MGNVFTINLDIENHVCCIADFVSETQVVIDFAADTMAYRLIQVKSAENITHLTIKRTGSNDISLEPKTNDFIVATYSPSAGTYENIFWDNANK